MKIGVSPKFLASPLRLVLTVPFVTLISATVGIVGFLSFQNGQAAVNQVATELRNQISDRLIQHLHSYLDQPNFVNQVNANSIRQFKTINIETFLWRQLQLFPSLNTIYYGTEKGEQFSARRDSANTFSVAVRQAETKWEYRRYLVDLTGKPYKFVSAVNTFDPRQRPWYKAASSSQPAWSAIYTDLVSQELAITAIQPVYDSLGKLEGVLGSDLFLGELQNFLAKLKVGKTGKTFILERSGDLVSISTRDRILINSQSNSQPKTSSENQRIKATESDNPTVSSTSAYLLQKFGSWERIYGAQSLDFDLNGTKQFVQVIPFRDRQSIFWLIVVVVPESDFMERINQNTQITILFCLTALIASLGISILIVRWITKPILQLNRAAKELIQGRWAEIESSDRFDELGELTDSFRQMAEKMKESFSTLQQKNELMEKLNEALSESGLRLSQFLATIPVGVLVCDLKGKIYYTNPILQTMFGDRLWQNFPKDLNQLLEQLPIFIADSEEIYPPSKLPILIALEGESAVIEDLEVRVEAQIIHLQVWGNPIFDSEGQIVYAIATFADITARRQAQKVMTEYNQTLEIQVAERTQDLSQAMIVLENTQTELVQKGKMAVLGQLVAGVAHEINTPLGAISSAAQNVSEFLKNHLGEMLEFGAEIKGSKPERFGDFIALIQIALMSKPVLSTREQRQIRKEISKTLTAEKIADPEAIANQIAGIGIHQQLTQFLPLLKMPEHNKILAKIYQLANLRTSASTMAIAAERCGKIVFALKTYSHSQEQESPTLTNLTETIETVITLYQSQIKQGVEVLRDYDSKLLPMLCYADDLTQVWTNLIHNALQSMQNRGVLEIKTELSETGKQQKQAIVKITDSGTGIPPELQTKIFEPFFTTKPAGEGSGLGLDIVRRMIEKHKGAIALESIPGSTTFTITLPINQPISRELVESEVLML